jgi:hypothetical protein
MLIDAYYRQVWAPAGVDPNILEKRLAAGIEADIKDALDCLCNSPARLSGDQASNLLAYMELQRIRVPRQAAWASEMMRQKLLELIGPELRAQLQQNRLRPTMKDSARFDFMRSTLGKLHPWFHSMEWEVYEAEPGTSFITTDSPVTFVNPRIPPPAEAGIGRAGTLVLFPLSSRKLMVMRHPGGARGDPMVLLPEPAEDLRGALLSFGEVMSADRVRQTNWYLAALSHHLCVAESEAPLREALADLPLRSSAHSGAR